MDAWGRREIRQGQANGDLRYRKRCASRGMKGLLHCNAIEGSIVGVAERLVVSMSVFRC